MGAAEQRNVLDRIRETDLVDLLSALGFEPEKPSRNGVDFYYLSPLRSESVPSFHVNRKRNQWFDHGLGHGGNAVDFGLRFLGCSLRELADRWDGNLSAVKRLAGPISDWGLSTEKESRVRVFADQAIKSEPLIRYLDERRIIPSVAQEYCREVHYALDGKNYYGIGFKNDSGGYEIRNAYVKLSSSPKNITVLGNSGNQVHVFEGFMDFLSFKTAYRHELGPNAGYVILNGAAFFEKARPVMEQRERIRLWLDRDTTGIAYTKYGLSLNKGYVDESGRYAGYKDLNEWLVGKGKVQKQQFKRSITGS